MGDIYYDIARSHLAKYNNNSMESNSNNSNNNQQRLELQLAREAGVNAYSAYQRGLRSATKQGETSKLESAISLVVQLLEIECQVIFEYIYIHIPNEQRYIPTFLSLFLVFIIPPPIA